jgi:CheY-like chemotaxis protein
VNQRLVLRQLEKLGLKADAVANGQEALDMLTSRGCYDIVLMDCQMPGMDGYEATTRLRQAESSRPPGMCQSLYIIALTANAFESDRERGMAVGMNDYLTKPVRLEELRRALERACHQTIGPALTVDSESSPAPLDFTIIASIKELRSPGQPDPVAELVHLFLKDALPRMESLQSLAQAHKAPDLKGVVHSLKGSSNNLGARRLAALFLQVETLCKTEDWGAIQQLLPQIRLEFEAVRRALLAQLSF